ncbi:hypothetical protein FRB99_008399 [Tulasnella sp. 403]|nr:hypothetical protein FRB99_008399 [Tulasnella sp. 403]
MNNDQNQVSALLAQRSRSLARYASRTESIVSSSEYSTSHYSPSEHHHQHVQESPAGPSTSEPVGYSPSLSGESSPIHRMSVLGPKIHKNGIAPWEMDGNLETVNDADEATDDEERTTIFGLPNRAKSKDKLKSSTKSSKARGRSKTVVEAAAPSPKPLRGLGFGAYFGAPSPTPNTGRSDQYAATLDARRPSLPDSFASSAEDDSHSVSTTTITDVRYASQLPDIVRNHHTTPPGQRSRARTVSRLEGTIQIDLSRNSSSSSLSLSRPDPVHPHDHARTPRATRLTSTDMSKLRPEDMFRASRPDSVSYYDDMGGSHLLHPYSNPELLNGSSGGSAFSSDSASPSPIDPSPVTVDTPSPSSFIEPPLSALPKDGSPHGDHFSPRSSPQPSVGRKKKTPPPPLILKSSPSIMSLSSAKRYPPKAASSKCASQQDLPNTEMSNECVCDKATIVAPSTANVVSVRNTPFILTEVASPFAQSPSPIAQRGPPLRAPSLSSEQSHTPQASLSPHPPTSAEDVPAGMRSFPGSPAYHLISLEQAQARARERSRSAGSSKPPPPDEGKVGGNKKQKDAGGIGGFVSRIRMNSEGVATPSLAAHSPLEPVSPGAVSTTPNLPSVSPTATPAASKPPLKHRKSGFLKLFTGGDKSGGPSPCATPSLPNSGYLHISAPTPIGLTAGGLPSPFTAVAPSGPRPSQAAPFKDTPSRGPLSRASVATSSSHFSSQRYSQAPSQISCSEMMEHPVPQLPVRYRSDASSTVTAVCEDMKSWKSCNTLESSEISSSAFSIQESMANVVGQQGSLSPNGKPLPTPPATAFVDGNSLKSPAPVLVEMPSPGSDGSGTMGSEKDREPVLRLRHISSKLLTSLPADYVVNPRSIGHSPQLLGDDRPPMLSPAGQSFNSVMTMSSMYASSESSLSPLPTPSSINHLSPTYPRAQTMHQSPVVFPHSTEDERGMVASLREQLLTTKALWKNEQMAMEKRLRELQVEVAKLKAEPMPRMVCCECGSSDVVRAPENGHLATKSVVNRRRAPTGDGGRFGSRLE